jgi:hypothetical protein
VTYVARTELELEAKVETYLKTSLKVLSLAGPTKSGKTVLVKKVIADPIWVSGGDVDSADGFWKLLVDKFDGWLAIEKSRRKSQTVEDEAGAGGKVSVKVVEIGGDVRKHWSEIDERVHAVRRDRPAQRVALDLLQAGMQPVVIDDFHYLEEADQLKIVRGLRSLVFEGLPVILLSVPHRAYDAVRAEPEMTGRMVPLTIPFWSHEDLVSIAELGFEELNVWVPKGDIKRLAEESFGSPFLMQDFCLALCLASGIEESQEESVALQLPEWPAFFRQMAAGTAKTAFERLVSGPPRRGTPRVPRRLKDGREVDIYGLALAAIASTGPRIKLTDDELRDAVRAVSADDPPGGDEITRVLNEMTKIARKMKGEPVVDYMAAERELHIADPFFAYYLRWGPHSEGI